MGDTLIELAPEAHQLEPHEQDEAFWAGAADDTRTLLSTSLLGLWTDTRDFRAGVYSDEGYASGGSTQGSSTTTGLEVFQQLGLLYSRGPVEMEVEPDSEHGWSCTNYVLVLNVHDDSLWVLWRKYIYYPETAIYTLAKDLWTSPYGVFPGRDDREDDPEAGTVICAKLAASWTALNPGENTVLSLTQVQGIPTESRPVPEPLLVTARRTAQGGIRRENDFRSRGRRC